MVESLTTPYLLLAAPVMLDPNFSKTVVVMGHHTREGALGWIVNRLLGEPAIKLLAPPLDTAVHPETPLRVGGPVLTNGLVALFPEVPALTFGGAIDAIEPMTTGRCHALRGGQAIVSCRLRTKIRHGDETGSCNKCGEKSRDEFRRTAGHRHPR